VPVNPYTGEVKEFSQQDIQDGTAARQGFTVQVKRDLSAKEIADGRIRLYAPCVCGSGKKFKFCCQGR
jgi:uncharacterized protein YchJ